MAEKGATDARDREGRWRRQARSCGEELGRRAAGDTEADSQSAAVGVANAPAPVVAHLPSRHALAYVIAY